MNEENTVTNFPMHNRKRTRIVIALIGFVFCFFFIDKTALIRSIGDIVVQHENSTSLDIIVFFVKTVISTVFGLIIATVSYVIEKLTDARIRKYTELPNVGLSAVSKRSIERHSVFNSIDYDCVNLGNGNLSIYFQAKLINTGDTSIASCTINKHSLHISEILPGHSVTVYFNIAYSKSNIETIKKDISIRYTDNNGNLYRQKFSIAISKKSYIVQVIPLEGRKEIRNA